MKRAIFSLFLSFCLLLIPAAPVRAALPVIDLSAIGKLIQQISQLRNIIHQLEALNEWANVDHLNLSSSQFFEFLANYGRLLDELIAEIEGYQNGGLLGQIERLDEVYFPYHEGWGERQEHAAAANPRHQALQKQLLWTKVQFKHAAKVAAKVRGALPQTQIELETLQLANFASEGLMQTLKIGNELTGMVARSVEVLNTQIAELLQAQAAEGLEKNTRQGLQNNRATEALFGWGESPEASEMAPLNPFGAY